MATEALQTMIRTTVILAALSLTLAASPARAEMVRSGFALEVSSMGLGGDLLFSLGDHLQARAGGNWLNYSHSGIEGESTTNATAMSYSGTLKLLSAGAIIDWYPTGNSFRVSAGLHLNRNQIEIDAKCKNPVACELGNGSFSPGVIGTVTTEISFAPVAPYFGIGFGNPLKQQGLSFMLDIGVLLQGSGDVDMKASGTCSGLCADELKNEEKEIEDEIKDFKFYPVLNLGLGYRF